MDGIEPPGRGDYPHLQPLHPAQLCEQRNQAGGNVGDDRQRRRPEHISRLYHSRTTPSITRSATTTITTIASITKSDSATRPPIYDVQHEQRHTVHDELDNSALILHSADINTSATDRQAGSGPPRR